MNSPGPGTAAPPRTRSLPSALSSPLARNALVLLLGALILFLRRPDQFTRPQLWAEDGIFFFQARVFGVHAFAMELAGYFHLAPRCIAALANTVDPAWVPHVFVGCTLALTLYVMSRALSPRCPLPARAACALAVVLVPDASEVILSAVNIQWILAAAFLLLLIAAEPQRPAQRVHDAIAVVFLGLTGPFSIVMTPFFAVRALVRRTRWSILLAVVVAVCAAVQGLSIVTHPQPVPPGGAFVLQPFVAFAGWRVLGGLLLGPWLPANLAWVAGTLLTLGLTVILVWLARRPGERRRVRVILAVTFATLLASTLARCWHSMPVLCVPGSATRYVYPLQLLLAWLVLASLGDVSRAVRATLLLALGWALVVNFPRLRQPALPDLHWETYAAKLRAGEEVEVPINPPGWTFPFPARPSHAQP